MKNGAKPEKALPSTKRSDMAPATADVQAFSKQHHRSQTSAPRLDWLSDGEATFGARLAVDEKYGLVGVPDWDTVVNLGCENVSRTADATASGVE